MRRSRITTPPRVLPLVLIGIVGINVGWQFLEVAGILVYMTGVALPAGEGLEDGTPLELALTLGANVVGLVVLSILLRWLVRRWVVRQPPDLPPR